jgi:hypothetical protein
LSFFPGRRSIIPSRRLIRLISISTATKNITLFMEFQRRPYRKTREFLSQIKISIIASCGRISVQNRSHSYTSGGFQDNGSDKFGLILLRAQIEADTVKKINRTIIILFYNLMIDLLTNLSESGINLIVINKDIILSIEKTSRRKR